MHMLTHACTSQKLEVMLEAGHWLTVGRLAAGAPGANTLCKHARHLRCSRGPCLTHTLCLPSTTDVAPYAETRDDDERDDEERDERDDEERDEQGERGEARDERVREQAP